MLAELADQVQGPPVIGPGPGLAKQARHGLDVVIERIRRCGRR